MDLTNYYEGLSSQRFLYRKLNYNDLLSWMEFYYDNPNLKYLGIDLNRPIAVMAKAWIEAQKERYENNAFGQLGIISKETNELVGTIGFRISEHCDEGEIEKMTAIKPAYWRQGIGKEATIALINAMFENNWAESIIGVRNVDNTSSGKFNQDLGFNDLNVIQTETRQVVKYRLTKTAWIHKRDYYYPIKYQNNILYSIGKTPLIKMNRLNEGLLPLMLGKMEFLNPGGSSKDRIGIRMIEAAERLGLLKPGGTIVEPTSGNTGIGLAQAAVVKGYKVIFTMNDKVCQEKRNILRGYGAEVVICPCGIAPDHPGSYYKVAERLTKEIPNSFCPNQYANENNPLAHYETTAPEIWRDTNGQITHFIAGMGTGGTITGTARYLKERNPNIKIIGIDAKGSLYRHLYDGTEGKPEGYKIEGIGQDFLPDTIDLDLIDEVITITDKEAYGMARQATRKEAWMVGSSAGAVIAGALQVGRRLDEDAVVVMLLPDSGKNYLSTIFNDEWMWENNLICQLSLQNEI